MDRFEAMTVLVAVVEGASLSAAGRKLGMPLATVSRKVSELESHLGAKLLNRTSRRLTLTEAGEAYVAACRRILDDVGQAERAAAGEYAAPKGDLVITAPIVFGRTHVLPIVVEFLRAYPEIDVRMALSDRIATLTEERIDLAVRIGELPDSRLVARSVGSIRRVVCGSPGYFKARGMPRHPADLRAHDCIVFEGLASPGWRFASSGGELSVMGRARLVVNTAEAAIDAAVAGLGVTRVLSYQAGDAIRSGRLVVALAEHEPAPWPVNLVFTGQGPVTQKLRAFIGFAAPRLKRALSRHAQVPARRDAP